MFYHDVLHRMLIKCEPDRVRAVFNYIKGRPGENELFDLNSIIPMPECIRVTAEMEGLGSIIEAYGESEVKAYKERCVAAERRCLAETGLPGWFAWSLSMWDTPRNVYQVGRYERVPDTLFFRSAGSSPFSPLLELSHIFPDMVIHLTYADESGYSLGHAVFAEGDGSDEYHSRDSEAGEDIWEGLKGLVEMKTEGCIFRCDDEDEWPSVIYVD
jgi:hypothetical protein